MRRKPNTHAVHRGFVSADEQKWIVHEARSQARLWLEHAHLVGPPESAPRFLEWAYRWLCDYRAGGPIPVPQFTFFRAWDLAKIMKVNLAPFGDLDAWNERPEQQGFVSAAERKAVLKNAGCTAKGGDSQNASFAEIWRFVVVERAGTMLAIPSYKMVRNSWDIDVIQPEVRQ